MDSLPIQFVYLEGNYTNVYKKCNRFFTFYPIGKYREDFEFLVIIIVENKG
jgi:hypothetical protein